MSRHMSERTTVRLSGELVKRAKHKAATEGRSLTALIEEGLRQVLGENPQPAAATRKLPRVSNATGGVLPGIDLSDSASLQELEDIEYVARLR